METNFPLAPERFILTTQLSVLTCLHREYRSESFDQNITSIILNHDVLKNDQECFVDGMNSH